jgi:hypothetical protein
MHRRPAEMVCVILHGAPPAEMPLVLAPRFDLTVNSSVALALGLTLSMHANLGRRTARPLTSWSDAGLAKRLWECGAWEHPFRYSPSLPLESSESKPELDQARPISLLASTQYVHL